MGKSPFWSGLDYPQVGSLIEGEPIKLLENTEVWMDGFVWFKILYKGVMLDINGEEFCAHLMIDLKEFILKSLQE